MTHASLSCSIVVPAFNEEERLESSLPRIASTARELDAEVILVDDGSADRTAEVASCLLRDVPRARLIRLPWNCGKGAAVKVGVSASHGEAIVFLDADTSADPADIPALLAALEHADLALGSRTLAGAEVEGLSMLRRVASRSFNHLTRVALGLPITDTQCGFKAFRSPSAKLLFHLSEVAGFAFDVELLVLAKMLGYRMAEVPIRWTAVEGSRVHPVRDPLAMSIDVLRTRLRCRRAARRIRALAPQHFESGIVDQFNWQADCDEIGDGRAGVLDLDIDGDEHLVIDLAAIERRGPRDGARLSAHS